MRPIVKQLNHRGYEPLQNRKAPSFSEEAQAAWRKFGGKASVLNALLVEQHYLCCYSELRADEEGWGYHIEHLENKSQNPARTFDPSNLLASAFTDQDLPTLKKQGRDVFGGHAPGKSQSVNMGRFISCLVPNCADFFAYLSDGRVIPAKGLEQLIRERAEYTIERLNLNSPYLIELRQAWWQELEQCYQQYQNQPKTLSAWVRYELLPRTDSQKLSRFVSLTRRFFGPMVERV